MSTFLAWRRTSVKDLDKCLELRPSKRGAEKIGDVRAIRAWHELFKLDYASKSALIELYSADKVEIVGFGFSTFVKASFAESELSDPRPGLNARIIESIDSGKAVIATYREIQEANTQRSLQQVVLDVSWREERLNAAQMDEVRLLLARSYQEIHAGYCISRVLAELIGEMDLRHVRMHPSFRIACSFKELRLPNSGMQRNGERALAVATRESMYADLGSIAAGLFYHCREPQFAFRPGEQQLLEVALEGLDDQAAAKSLFLSVAAIKRRWVNIFRRVAAIQPDIYPPNEGGLRGIQKRQRVLTYVRNHPEELRPFDFGKGKKRKGRLALRSVSGR